MKKFIYAVALFLTSASSSAMDVEFGGQHRVRGIYYQQEIEDAFIQRFKFSGSFRPNEMFESHFWLMTNYKWGDIDYSNNEIRIYGYGDWKVSDELVVRLGRSPYQMADGSSVGMNDYAEYPYVMDGAFVSYNTESLAVDLWASYLPKVWQSTVATAASSMEVKKYDYAMGLSLDVRSLPEEFKMANLFGLYVHDNNDSNSHFRLSVGIGGDLSGIDYKLTSAIHGPELGEITDQYAVDAELGYTLDFDARLYVGAHYESEAYDSFYYNYHGRSGLMDVAQWGNGTIYGQAGITYMPTEDFEIGVAGVYFQNIGSWGQWGNGGNKPEEGAAALSQENVIEADIYLKKSYAGGFSIALQAGLFDVMADSPFWQAQLNTTFDF